MPTTAKVRSLQVRPIQSSDLAFDAPGVIAGHDRTRARLGQRIQAFDSATELIAKLRGSAPATPERLTYDSRKIRTALAGQYLFFLRNDAAAATLDQSVAQREMSYLQKYKFRTEIARDLRDLYNGRGGERGKLAQLQSISENAVKQRAALKTEYEKDRRDGVIKETESGTVTSGKVESETLVTPVAIRNTQHYINVRNTKDGNGDADHLINTNQAIPQTFAGGWNDVQAGEYSLKSSKTVTDAAGAKQTTISKPFDYRHPYFDALIAGDRLSADTDDDLFMNRVFSYRLPFAETLLDRELDAIDLDVAQAQIRYAQSFLTSPIAGVVTTIYKDLGEAVQAGEPVIRVENDERILMVGLIQYRSLLRIGTRVRVTSSLYDTSPAQSIDGELVSVRGHDSDDDEWDVIIECDNTLRLPLNYTFDRDVTTVTVP